MNSDQKVIDEAAAEAFEISNLFMPEPKEAHLDGFRRGVEWARSQGGGGLPSARDVADAAGELLSLAEIDPEYKVGTDLWVAGEVLRQIIRPFYVSLTSEPAPIAGQAPPGCP